MQQYTPSHFAIMPNFHIKRAFHLYFHFTSLFNVPWFLKCNDQYFITAFHNFSWKVWVKNNGKTLNSIKDFQKVAKINNQDKVKSFQEGLNVIFTKRKMFKSVIQIILWDINVLVVEETPLHLSKQLQLFPNI